MVLRACCLRRYFDGFGWCSRVMGCCGVISSSFRRGSGGTSSWMKAGDQESFVGGAKGRSAVAIAEPDGVERDAGAEQHIRSVCADGFPESGELGSGDFFRVQFATPVDRNGDKEAAARLRKLVYPFILRRTKEQVAPDLPDRTEMILCVRWRGAAQGLLIGSKKKAIGRRCWNGSGKRGWGRVRSIFWKG